jgi:hypothetical protein
VRNAHTNAATSTTNDDFPLDKMAALLASGAYAQATLLFDSHRAASKLKEGSGKAALPPKAWAAAIDVADRSGDVARVRRLFDEYAAAAASPTSTLPPPQLSDGVFHLAVPALSVHGDVAGIERCFAAMRALTPPVHPDVFLYNDLLRAHAHKAHMLPCTAFDAAFDDVNAAAAATASAGDAAAGVGGGLSNNNNASNGKDKDAPSAWLLAPKGHTRIATTPMRDCLIEMEAAGELSCSFFSFCSLFRSFFFLSHTLTVNPSYSFSSLSLSLSSLFIYFIRRGSEHAHLLVVGGGVLVQR